MTSNYVIVQTPAGSGHGFAFFGGAGEFWKYHGHEAMLSGAYETGKTVAALMKLHCLLCKYPNSRALMIRKTYKSLVQSAVVTYEKKVLPLPPEHPKSGVQKYGGERPEFYDYPNGSRLVCGGLDNADKVLSAEYDFIYVNQSEELSIGEWETLTGRATGRAGNAPYSQVFGDCNPSHPQHWIQTRPTLKIFAQNHEHNPTLFNQQTGAITEQGQRTLAILDALTGVRYKRGRLGLWVAAEGAVYEEFNAETHIVDKLPDENNPFYFKRCIAGSDWGYKAAGVQAIYQIDGDGRAWLVHEVYMSHRQMDDFWIPKARELYQRYKFEVMLCDPSEPAFIEQMRMAGIPAQPADNEVRIGIDRIKDRLAVQKHDNCPRLLFYRQALEEIDYLLAGEKKPVGILEEITGYMWAKTVDGRAVKEEVIKVSDHSLDVLRYVINHLDAVQGVGLARL